MRLRELTYHGPGFATLETGDLDPASEYELIVWLPRGPHVDGRQQSPRADYRASYRADPFAPWGEVDDNGDPVQDWRVDRFERFDTAAALAEWLRGLSIPLADREVLLARLEADTAALEAWADRPVCAFDLEVGATYRDVAVPADAPGATFTVQAVDCTGVAARILTTDSTDRATFVYGGLYRGLRKVADAAPACRVCRDQACGTVPSSRVLVACPACNISRDPATNLPRQRRASVAPTDGLRRCVDCLQLLPETRFATIDADPAGFERADHCRACRTVRREAARLAAEGVTR